MRMHLCRRKPDTSLMEKVSEAVDCTMENNDNGITVRDLGADPNVRSFREWNPTLQTKTNYMGFL